MSDVPDDAISGRIKNMMYCNGEFNDTETRTEMAARHADEARRVTIAVSRLMQSTGLSESSVKRALAELQDKRMLKVKKRGGGGKDATTYVLAPYPMPSRTGAGGADSGQPSGE